MIETPTSAQKAFKPSFFYLRKSGEVQAASATLTTHHAAVQAEPRGTVAVYNDSHLREVVVSAQCALRGVPRDAAVLIPGANLMPEISTGHLRATTRAWLTLHAAEFALRSSSEGPSLYYAPWSIYGWIVIVTDDCAEAVRDKAPELATILDMAAAEHVTYVKFDADANFVEGLPVYEDHDDNKEGS